MHNRNSDSVATLHTLWYSVSVAITRPPLPPLQAQAQQAQHEEGRRLATETREAQERGLEEVARAIAVRGGGWSQPLQLAREFTFIPHPPLPPPPNTNSHPFPRP